MVIQEFKSLANQFQNLELHAAHSGRVVLTALNSYLQSSQSKNLGQLIAEIQENCKLLLPVLPPYAPPLNSINQVMLILESIENEALDLDEVKKRVSNLSFGPAIKNIHGLIAENLVSVLPNPVSIYTHTLSETLLGVLLVLHNKELIRKVYVTESRPNNDGWVTAKKLAEVEIETHLTLDMAFPKVIDEADLMLSGTESINLDGSVVCKVGVYPASMYCKKISKPVYILADTRKISLLNSTFLNMTAVSLESLGLIDPPPKLFAYGSYFDTTPSEFISGYVTENGLLSAKDLLKFGVDQPVSKWLKSQLLEMNQLLD